MCRGDISLVTFVWSPKDRLPLADLSRPHECVNFDALDKWSGEHRVNALAPGLLQHPTLGEPLSASTKNGILNFPRASLPNR